MINMGKNVKDCLDFYAGDYAEENNIKSIGTMISNCKWLEKYIGQRNIRDISDDIRRYKRFHKQKDKVDSGTIRRKLSVLSTTLKTTVEEGIIHARNEIRIIEKLKIMKLPAASGRGIKME